MSERDPQEKINARIAYQFCGSGDMQGGVQDSINTFGGYIASEYGGDPYVLVGSSEKQANLNEVFSNFDSNHISVLGLKNHYIAANGGQNSIGSLVMPAHAKDVLHQIKPDIVHIMAPWKPYIGGIVLRQAESLGIPTVATYHIYSQKLITNGGVRLASLLDRRLISRLDTLIAVSEPAEKHLRAHFSYKGKVEQIPNAVDVKRYEAAKPFESGEPFDDFDPVNNKIVVFVGRPDERKGLKELLDAGDTLLNRRYRDIQMIICGDGPKLKDFQEYAAKFTHSNSIKFVGRVSDSDKARWLASADVAAFPARGNESQGIVLLEAMAAGAGVVIGSSNEGYKSVLDNLQQPDEVMFRPERVMEMVMRIETLFNNSSMAKVIHEKQQELVRAKYDISVVGRQVADIYRNLL